MAEISEADVEKTAALAKLEFSGEEKKKFVEQFSKIVGFVEKISELDTGNVSPMTHAVEKSNVMRDDEEKPSMPPEDIEKNAPKYYDGNIIVPKIIEY